MIIPGTTLIITQYQLATYFKLTNKLLGLVPFYVAWVIPFSTFMIKNYIESIPRDFDEAVYVDGGSIFTVFFRIVMPLASPAIASVSIFNFLTAWDEYQWALTVINDNAKERCRLLFLDSLDSINSHSGAMFSQCLWQAYFLF